MSERVDGPEELKQTRRTRPASPPNTVEEAMRRARSHGRIALAETLRAARALLDAAALITTGEPAHAHGALGALARGLDELSLGAAGDAERASAPLVEAILDALDLEIERWELRSSEDVDARAVLRAFLGLREILWEFGLRRADGTESRAEASPPEEAPAAETKPETAEPVRGARKTRIQRVRVQG
jgi:hypothetical protein